ncbi:MAG TPA: hypothetical protein VF961_11045, partial [Pyrinomonadaceae bacterium]
MDYLQIKLNRTALFNDLRPQLVATKTFPKSRKLTYNARRSLTAEVRIRSQLQESHIDLPSIKKLEVKPSKIATLSFHHQGRQEFKIMFKLFSASLIIAAACAFGMAQGP